MSGEFDSRKDSHSTKLEVRPQISVKLSSRELNGSNSHVNIDDKEVELLIIALTDT